MKTTVLVAALLIGAAPAQAASQFRAPTVPAAAQRALPAPAQAAQTPARLFDTCTREGMRKGRYSAYSWCEWFSYFHQNK